MYFRRQLYLGHFTKNLQLRLNFFIQNEFTYYSSRLYLKTMFNLDSITEKSNNKDWPYRKLIIGPSGS